MATTEKKNENIDNIDEVEKIFQIVSERNRQMNEDAQRIQEENDRKNKETSEQQRKEDEIKQAKEERRKRKARACFVLICITIIAAFGTFYAAINGIMMLISVDSAILAMIAAILGAIIGLAYKTVFDYLKKEICTNK